MQTHSCTHTLVTGLLVPGPPGLTRDLAIHRRRHTGQCRLKLKESVSDPPERVHVLMQEFGDPRVNVVIADKADDESIAGVWGTRRTA